ncbi:MAG: exodeoxyribonuclease III [Desulfovibrionaceae bacterium]|nr:exodeoxyribonuclease III [Desulfovibrionaceae bacterium]
MNIYSWNVNGFRAVVGKGFWDWLGSCGADVVLLQETKVHPDQLEPRDHGPQGWDAVWNWSKAKKGYSGTACLFRARPVSRSLGLPGGRFQGEGRLILLEYEAFFLLNVYFPNGQMSQERLDFKLAYYDAFLDYAQELRRTKPVVVGGDFNTAHKAIDLKNPKANEKTSGFLPVERAWLDRFVAAGWVDTFRMFEPGGGHYSWWSYRFNARSNNAGWRIDYFFVCEELRDRVRRAWIEPGVMGSDHCPVGLELDV